MSDEKKNPIEDNSKEKGAIVSSNAANLGENTVKNKELKNSGSAKSTASDSGSQKTKKTTKQGKKRVYPWFAGIALLLVLGLGAGNYWQYQQSQQLNLLITQLSQRQSEVGDKLSSFNAQVAEIQNQQKSTASKLEQNEQGQKTLIASLDQMSQQLKSLSTAKGKEPLFWRISEVEYLLTVANYRLVLERDVATAKTALEDADKRLRVIGDPGLIPVREKISQEINQLNNVQLPDIPGMAAQLNSVIEGVGQLPFVKKSLAIDSVSEPESEKEFTGVSSLLKSVWTDLVDGLFKVQRTDQAIEPLLPPEEKYYLLQNLGLILEQARVSLLNSDTALFHSNLTNAELWVHRYFDLEDTSVKNLLQTVQEMKQIELYPELPDISASLREVRTWLEIQQQNVASKETIKASSRLARSDNEATSP
ncbi:MAG: uroporphyrinogen-III C-methyltransferase [Gammaproteobacteria bacterium]|jgi:uroporphyrin-3 C-methyltransferase